MENKSWNKVLEKIESLVSDILTSDLYLSYQALSLQLSNHEKAISYIDRIKHLQKDIVLQEFLLKDTSMLDEEIHSLQRKLEDIPLYQDYLEKERELDSLFQSIKGFLEEHLDHIVNDSL